MKLKGLKKAIDDYERANDGGKDSDIYGQLMLNTETGEIWTDAFYGVHHNYFAYDDPVIVNLSAMLDDLAPDLAVELSTVQEFVNRTF